MSTIGKIGIGIAIGVGTALAVDLIHLDIVKRRAWNYAQSLDKGRGIINLGAGPHRSSLAQEIAEAKRVAVNIDILPDGMPKFRQLDIQKGLPYPDKSFGVVWFSHLLEHLEDWESALREACRVADSVVVVLPHPLSLTGRLSPNHLHFFSYSDMERIEREFPNVKVFC